MRRCKLLCCMFLSTILGGGHVSRYNTGSDLITVVGILFVFVSHLVFDVDKMTGEKRKCFPLTLESSDSTLCQRRSMLLANVNSDMHPRSRIYVLLFFLLLPGARTDLTVIAVNGLKRVATHQESSK